MLGVAHNAEQTAIKEAIPLTDTVFGNGRHGELYLRIEVHVPDELGREERELYERLRAVSGKQAWHFSKLWGS